MNDDRISEVYKGEIWSSDAQERARRRIHWMIRQVEGSRVLDIGCSQGIASILLGREGFEVVGIDVQQSRIDYAKRDLDQETEATRERVTFEVGEGADLRFPDESFDNVLLGEVIEHLAVPERVLAEAARVLRTGGKMVITTPFGVLHHHDHKQTFYPDDLFQLVSRFVGIQDADIRDRYFRLVGEKGKESAPRVLQTLRVQGNRTVEAIQEELAELRVLHQRQSRALADTENARATVERKYSDELRYRNKVENAWKQTKAELREVRGQLSRAKDEAKRFRVDVSKALDAQAKAEARADALAVELKRAGDKALEAERLAVEMRRLHQQLEKRSHQVETWRHRYAVADWKLKSLRRRRWWRLGSELASVRRNPIRIVRLPIVLWKVLTTSVTPIPRPEMVAVKREGRPEAKSDSVEGSQTEQTWIEPVIPRRDRVAVGILGGELFEVLSHEFQLYRLTPERWKAQLAELVPTILLVEADEISRTDLPLHDVLDAADAAGIESILWATDECDLAPDLRSRFAVISGIGKSCDDLKGRFVERTGSLQARIFNPVSRRTRKRKTADINYLHRQLSGREGVSPSELARSAKEHKLLHAFGESKRLYLAALAATGTPIIGDASSDYVVQVADDEEREALERSLLRSEVLRSRIAHPRMREALRKETLSPHIDALICPQMWRWPRIDVMIPTRRPDRLTQIFDNLGRQTYPDFTVWLVAHGIDLDESSVRDLANERGVVLSDIVRVDEDVVLGEVFNIGFAETEAKYVAKMDDDDYYGPEYLWDLYTALDFSGAEVAGKWAHYVYLEGVDSMVYRFANSEHRFTDVVAISTLLMKRDVIEAERFPPMPWGSGSRFLRALGAQGARVYAADRWNYLYIRGRDGIRNTYPVSDLRLLAKSDVVCKGLVLDEVLV